VVEYDEFGDLELVSEDRVPLNEVLKTVGESLIYNYDFGGEDHAIRSPNQAQLRCR
jgi:hypothetical protein